MGSLSFVFLHSCVLACAATPSLPRDRGAPSNPHDADGDRGARRSSACLEDCARTRVTSGHKKVLQTRKGLEARAIAQPDPRLQGAKRYRGNKACRYCTLNLFFGNQSASLDTRRHPDPSSPSQRCACRVRFRTTRALGAFRDDTRATDLQAETLIHQVDGSQVHGNEPGVQALGHGSAKLVLGDIQDA